MELFSPLHLLILLISAVIFGATFLFGFVLGRYVELRKLKKP